MRYTFKDEVRTGGRKPTLWIINRGKIHEFAGKMISGVAEVRDAKFEVEGDRSSTEYQIELVKGAVPCLLLASMHGRLWPEADIPSAYKRFKKQYEIKVSTNEFNMALVRHFPLTYHRMVLEPLDPWSKEEKTSQSES
jgi:hypothetical protein